MDCTAHASRDMKQPDCNTAKSRPKLATIWQPTGNTWMGSHHMLMQRFLPQCNKLQTKPVSPIQTKLVQTIQTEPV
jgi:hypothetical protein